jgi:hypothetical protein
LTRANHAFSVLTGSARLGGRRSLSHHPDIVAIQFHAVPVARLDEAERQMIQNQRDAGHHLRDLDVVSRTWGDSVLDAVIDQEVRANWANGEPQTHPDDLRMLMAPDH